MKKLLALSALTLALISGTATASNGEVRFIGAVTDVTCDLVPSVDGNVSNLIQLGTAAVNGDATPVNFSLKSGGDAGCAALTDTDVVKISFAGELTDAGLGAQSGLATDAYVTILSKNAAADNTAIISKGSDTREFAGDLFKDANAVGAQFEATLHGQSEAGDYQSALAFVVAYM